MSDHTHNTELERFLLGSVLICDGLDSQKMWSVIRGEIQGPHAFYERDHQFVAMAMDDQLARGLYLDGMSIATSLSHVSFHDAIDALREIRTGKARRFNYDDGLSYDNSVMAAMGGTKGGYNFVAELSNRCTKKFETARSNARTLAEYHRLRQAIEVVKSTQIKLESPTGLVDLRPIVESATHNLIKVIGGRSGTRSLDEAMEAVIATHNEAKNQEKRKMPQWPLSRLNTLCRFRDGSLVVLAATSGGGKTSLALQTAEATAEYVGGEGCVGVVSREMTAEDLTRILVSRRAGVSVESLERGEADEHLETAQDSIRQISKSVLVCDSMEKLTHREVCAWARSHHTRTNGALRLLIVDHLGLLDPENPRQSEYERTTAATRALKALAMELRIVVLALCQLNRDSQKRNLGNEYGAEDFEMSALKGSGSIENDADQCVFICKQGADSDMALPVKLKIAKNRWGSKGEFPATFLKGKGQTFRENGPVPKHRGVPDTQPRDSEDLFI
jgi:replicative DNA helicase